MRVLVVEDVPIVAMAVADQLAGAGHVAIGPATTVHQALELIKSASPEAALLDIWLERDTSAAVASALMAARIPFIVLSAHPPDLQPLIFRNGHWVMKPHDEKKLLEAIGTLA
jgi:two-component system, response regulator PdtaR